MTSSAIFSEPTPMEKGPQGTKVSQKRGRDSAGRPVEEIQEGSSIGAHMDAIQEQLRTINEDTTRAQKLTILSDLAPHVSALRSLSKGIIREDERPEAPAKRRKITEESEIIKRTTSLLLQVQHIEEAIAMEEEKPEAMISRKRGREPSERSPEENQEASSDDIEDHMRVLRNRLRTIKKATPSEMKRAALSDLASHIAAVKSFSMRATRKEEQVESEHKRQKRSKRTQKKPEQRVEEAAALLQEVQHIEESVAGEEQADEIKKIISDAIQNAESSDDPVETLATAYQSVQKYFEADIRFRPFLREAERLMNALRNKPDMVKGLVLPLLKAVLLTNAEQGGMLPRDGIECIGLLLFAIDNNLLEEDPISLEELGGEIEDVVAETLHSIKTKFDERPLQTSGHIVYQPILEREVLLPYQIAKALIRPDGTINLGIIKKVKAIYVERPTIRRRDLVERHIISMLRELEANEKLLHLIESIPVPQIPSSLGLVNAMLLRPYNDPVSEADVRVATLAALLTCWRQGNIGNCFVVSNAIQFQEGASEWLVEDFRDLLASGGKLTRTVQGQQRDFYGFECPSDIVMSTKIERKNINVLFSLEPIQNACRELGCTTAKEFEEIAERTCLETSSKETTLFKIFEELRKKNGKSLADLRRACWIAESPSQNLLLRLWENAAGGTNFMPLTDTRTKYSEMYLTAIFEAFGTVAKKLDLFEIQTSTLGWILHRVGLPLLGGQATPLAALITSQTLPASLHRLRACLIPQSEGRPQELSWGLYEDTGGAIVPFKDRQEISNFLYKAFIELVDQAGGVLPEQERSKLLSTIQSELIEAFEAKLKKLYSVQKGGPVFDLYCYQMRGAFDGMSIERSGDMKKTFTVDMQVKYGKNLLIDIFKNFLPWAEPIILRDTVTKFMDWATELRTELGPYPDLYVPCTGMDHAFAILPNHPSIVRAQERSSTPVEDKEEYARKIKECVKSPSELMTKVQKDIAGQALLIAGADGTDPDTVYSQIVDLFHSKFLSKKHTSFDSLSQCDIESFLTILWSAIQSVATQHGAAPIKVWHGFLISALISLFPDYNEQFLYFADSNWREDLHGMSEKKLLCFWYNPFGEWTLLSMPESDTISSILVYEASQAIKFKHTWSLRERRGISPDLLSKIRQKELLLTDRKMVRKLQKIEYQFIEKWSVFKKASSQLQEDLRQSLRSQLDLKSEEETPPGTHLMELPSIQKAPQEWRSALEECLVLRQQYQKLLKDRSIDPTMPRCEYRYMQWFPTSSVTRLLMDSEGSLLEEVTEALS